MSEITNARELYILAMDWLSIVGECPMHSCYKTKYITMNILDYYDAYSRIESLYEEVEKNNAVLVADWDNETEIKISLRPSGTSGDFVLSWTPTDGGCPIEIVISNDMRTYDLGHTCVADTDYGNYVSDKDSVLRFHMEYRK